MSDKFVPTKKEEIPEGWIVAGEMKINYPEVILREDKMTIDIFGGESPYIEDNPYEIDLERMPTDPDDRMAWALYWMAQVCQKKWFNASYRKLAELLVSQCARRKWKTIVETKSTTTLTLSGLDITTTTKNTKARSFVYFLRTVGAETFYKVGVSRNTKNRMRDLQNANPQELEFVVAVAGPPTLEKMFHRLLKAERIKGEWYQGPITTAVVESLISREWSKLSQSLGGSFRPIPLTSFIEIQIDKRS